LHPKYRLTIPFLAPTRSSFRPPKAVSPLRGHREPCFFALFLVIAILSFRPFPGHCEPRFFALSPVIASLVCSSGEAISDCFASLAVTPTLSLRARSFVCEAVSPQRFLAASRLGTTDEECHCEIVFLFPKQSRFFAFWAVIASSFLRLRSNLFLFHPGGILWKYETASLRSQ